jgi:putative ABC transport system permease protein
VTFWNDVRLAARLLLKDTWFTLAAMAALALGLAANNTVFTIVNGVLLRDLPFEEPDRIVSVGVKNPPNAQNSLGGVSFTDFYDWREALTTFDGIAAFAEDAMTLSEEGFAPVRFRAAFITTNAFDLIGARPILGRGFRPDDDRDGAEPVVMLGYEVWRNRYQSDRNIVGRAIRVNGVSATVIGVMAEGFLFPQRAFLWQPLAAVDDQTKTDRRARGLGAFGRLKVGTTKEQAAADLQTVTARLATQYPDTNQNIEGGIAVFRSGIGGPIRPLFVSMMGAVAFVLLIACANVANLLLSRAGARAREISVRMSIGASRWRIVRQLLVESLLLAVAAGTVGLLLSMGAIELFWISAANTDPPYWMHFGMDWRVFSFLAVVTLGTALVFGLAPALFTSKTNLADVLNDAGRGSAGRRRGRRWSGVLVAGQLALALVLLTGAGLMLRNIMVLSMMDAGVDTANLIRARLELSPPMYASPERRIALFRQFEDRIASAPELRATLANAIPLIGGASRNVSIDGQTVDNPALLPRATVLTVGRHYFDVLGVRLLQGRRFTDGEGGAGRGVAIVNQQFVATYLRDVEPLGRRMQVPDGARSGDSNTEWMTIVGVAQNVRQRPPADGGFDPVVYVPNTSNALWSTNVLVRGPADPGLAASLLRQHLRALDPELPISDVQRVDDFIYTQRWAQRTLGGMFVIFGVIALVLAAIGLYAVTAYSVAQRTREFGVRVALGAQARHVAWLVTRGASWQLASGLVIGIAGSVAVSRAVPVAITRVDGTDPMTLGIAVTLLILVAATACLIPGRRAMRLNPIEALRSE